MLKYRGLPKVRLTLMVPSEIEQALRIEAAKLRISQSAIGAKHLANSLGFDLTTFGLDHLESTPVSERAGFDGDCALEAAVSA